MNLSLINARLWTKFLLLAIVLLYIITGLGIKYYQIIEKITFGILTKSLSFKIHDILLIPFLILLFLHIYLTRRIK